MADLQAKVPEEVESRLDHLLGPAGGLPRRDEGDVDVGVKRHFAPAVAADRHQQKPLRGGWIAERVEAGRGEVVGEAEDLVGQEGVGGRGFASLIGLFLQPTGDLGPPVRQRLFQE